MTSPQRFQTVSDYWDGMVLPDFEDFQANKHDLRKAFHLATSLFHMADWVWTENEATIREVFQYTDKNGERHYASDVGQFANALSELSEDFMLVRYVANAGKHMALTQRANTPPNVPMYSANVATYMAVTEVSYGAASDHAISSGPISGGTISTLPEVILETPTNTRFFKIAVSVRDFWAKLRSENGW